MTTKKPAKRRGRRAAPLASPRSTPPFTPPGSPPRSAKPERSPLPRLLTVDEVADLLRTSRKAVYTLISRGKLPGVIRLPRRLLIDSADLLHWLHQQRAVSLTQGEQR